MAADRKQAAKKFREHWLLAKDSELGGYQKFWISLLGEVLGAKDVLTRIDFCGSIANIQFQYPIGRWHPIGKWQQWNSALASLGVFASLWVANPRRGRIRQHFHNGNINLCVSAPLR